MFTLKIFCCLITLNYISSYLLFKQVQQYPLKKNIPEINFQDEEKVSAIVPELSMEESTSILGPAGNDCPPGQTKFSINDIKLIIDYIVSSEFKSITYTNFSGLIDAELTNRLYSYYLERNIYNDKEYPSGLLHVLEVMENKNSYVDGLVTKISDQLKLYPQVEEQVSDRMAKVNELLAKFAIDKQICEINCNKTVKTNGFSYSYSYHWNSLVNEDTYYCSTIADLKAAIYKDMSVFDVEFKQFVIGKNNAVVDEISTLIKDFARNVKILIADKFKMTMLDLLSLEDDYFNYVNELEKINVAALYDDVGKMLAKLDFQLINLNDGLIKYAEYCKNCKNINVLRSMVPFDFTEVMDEYYYTTTESPNILDTLINEKKIQIKSSFESAFNETFKELKHNMTDEDFKKSIVYSLTELQSEIETNISNQKKYLYELKKKVPLVSIHIVQDLVDSCNSVYVDVLNTLQYISRFIVLY